MTYSLYTPTGSAHNLVPLTVPDNAIDTALYDSTNKLGVQLVGRNAIDYGTAVAQNTIQMVSNFAGSILPNDTIALQGQLWFNATSTTTGLLYVKTTSTAGGLPNWHKVVTVSSSETGTTPVINPSGTPKDGDMQIVGSVISIYAAGSWRQVFPAIYS
jgi:hypothetical protein